MPRRGGRAGVSGLKASEQPCSASAVSTAELNKQATSMDVARAGAVGAAGFVAGTAVQHARTPSDTSTSGMGKQAHALTETGKLLAAGGVAGAVSKSATAPLARMTILYQVSGFKDSGGSQGRLRMPNMREAFHSIVRNEGLAALWKGNGATIVHRLPYSAINFWAYERLTEMWNASLPPPADPNARSSGMDLARRLSAGGAAGMCACTVAYPLDLLRTRLAAQTSGSYYSGITSSLATIVRDEGFVGLYRGLGATLIQVAPSLAINYCAYETLRSHWLSYQPGLQSPTVAMSLLCGSFAGLISSTATFPLDLARRRMQLQGQHGQAAKYRSYPDVFKQIYASRGLGGFYAGIIPEYAKVIPGVAIAFCSYELMKKMLGVQTNITNR